MPLTSYSESELEKISTDNYRFLCQAVYQDSGIVLDDSKTYLVEARLIPVAKSEGATSLDALCNLIRATNGNRVRNKVVEAMTTNETLFFRDVSPFDALRTTLIPEMREALDYKRPLRLWSAACSSGQEPYSIAMLWLEMGLYLREVEILGTDLSEEMLAKAEEGRFLQLEVNRGLPAKYLVKYFTRHNLEWQIKPELRAMVKWRKFNLKDNLHALGHFDIVLCRNVLIYFDIEAKRRILNQIKQTLQPGGYLVLGSSETTLNLDDTFARRKVGRAILYQKPER